MDADQGRGPARARARRAARAGDAHACAGPRGWPHLLLLLGDQVYADEVPPLDRRVHHRAARRVRPARRAGRRLPGVLPSVRGLVVGARRPLAAVDGGQRDDLRRPRRPRRLEHVPRLGARHPRAGVGGTSGSSAGSCPTGVSSTSATCRPRTAWTTTTYRACARARVTPGRSCASSPSPPTARSRAPGGATGATSGGRGLVVMDSRAGRVLHPDHRLMVDDEEWACIEGWAHGSPDHPCSAPRCRRSWAAACTTSRPGTRRSARAPGAPLRRCGPSACARDSTSSTGRRSGARCARSRTCSSASRAGATARRRAASSCSRATCYAYLARAVRVGRRGRRPSQPRLPGGVLAAAQSARQPRAPGDPHRHVEGRRAHGRALARAAGVEPETMSWTIDEGPWFDNQVATLGARGAARLAGARQGGRARRRSAAPRAGDAPAPLVGVPRPLGRVSSPDGREDGRRQRRRCRPGSAGAGAPASHPLKRRHAGSRPARGRDASAGSHSRAVTPAAGSRSTTSSRSPASAS